MAYDFNNIPGKSLGIPIKNNKDGYVVLDSLVKGGYFVVDDFTNINAWSIVRGSQCYVTSTKTLYVFDPSIADNEITDDNIEDIVSESNNWKPLTLGASFEYADHVLTIKVPIVS